MEIINPHSWGVHIYIYIYTFTCMYSVYTYTYAYTYTFTYVYVYVYIYIYLFICIPMIGGFPFRVSEKNRQPERQRTMGRARDQGRWSTDESNGISWWCTVMEFFMGFFKEFFMWFNRNRSGIKNWDYSGIHWITGWWFGTFFIFPYIGNNLPNWLIFFRGVQTTNQIWINLYFWPWFLGCTRA